MSFAVFSVLPIDVDCTSTTGDSAETVTLSFSDASWSCASTVSVWFSESVMLERVNVWKPDSSNFSEYTPEGSDGNR